MNSLSLATILAQESSEGGGLLSLLIILIPLGAIFYLMIMPQRKARHRQAEMIRKLDVGDEVVTNGGILGVITHVEDDVYHLEVDNDVVVRVAKSAIASTTSTAEDEPPSRTRKGMLGAGKDSAGKDSAGKDDDAQDDRA